jgi:hypothetical protein
MMLQYSYLLWAVVLIALVKFVTATSKYLARRRFKLANGCLPIQRRYPHKDPFLGLDLLRRRMEAAKNRRVLDLSRSVFDQLQCNTYLCRIITSPVIFTIEVGCISVNLLPPLINANLARKHQNYS